ncbi:MAG: hypothetical protein ACLFQV_04370 [Vulcanimicrobiota bacterium]
MDFAKEKGKNYLQFLSMLLSMTDGNVESELHTAKHKGTRIVRFAMELEVDEHNYLVCQDLAFQNLLKSGGSYESDTPEVL